VGVIEDEAPAASRAASRRRPLIRYAILFVILAAVAFGVLRLVPASDYLFLPHEARSVAPLVTVPGDRAPVGAGGIYMVDILVRKASLLERLFPGINEGADLVDDQVLNPEGVSEDQRTRRADTQMATSRDISAAVALRALGYDVTVTSVGAQVQLVTPASDAYGRLQPGDVITTANGREVSDRAELREVLATLEPGDPVTLGVRTADGLEQLTVATRESEQEAGRAVIGIEVLDAAQIDLPLDITIDAGDVGGPSAGLAFALDVVDELGTEVDDGRTVVVTGALALDGTVEPVGGIKQKAIGAVRSDADVLVVPTANADVARQHAGDDLRVLAVDTFDDALRGLGVDVPAA
jgi:PDZ domain-containing protein